MYTNSGAHVDGIKQDVLNAATDTGVSVYAVNVLIPFFLFVVVMTPRTLIEIRKIVRALFLITSLS